MKRNLIGLTYRSERTYLAMNHNTYNLAFQRNRHSLTCKRVYQKLVLGINFQTKLTLVTDINSQVSKLILALTEKSFQGKLTVYWTGWVTWEAF